MDPIKPLFFLFSSHEGMNVENTEEKSGENLNLLKINGAYYPDLIKLHKYLKKKFDLPLYSHPNLDSLDEILNDPDWLEAQIGLKIELRNYPALLFREGVDRKHVFIQILYSMIQSLGYNAVYIEDCESIRKDLKELSMAFENAPSFGSYPN